MERIPSAPSEAVRTTHTHISKPVVRASGKNVFVPSAAYPPPPCEKKACLLAKGRQRAVMMMQQQTHRFEVSARNTLKGKKGDIAAIRHVHSDLDHDGTPVVRTMIHTRLHS